ncbi:MAG: D-sedoheptulose 7-phosphate isomerase [Puniceicoccales bacterium]|jgi:D-sedoheptulose 7-phosphate isomerase|nr:D-sedoheptulose 7-phosphate isomerase [Puniceicoccales bacterium]
MDNPLDNPAGFIAAELALSERTIAAIAHDDALLAAIGDAARILEDAFRAGKKVLLAGNGGSAADAQHIAAEFASRFNFDRAPLPAIALTTDSSILTSISNDYGFRDVFSRQVVALGNPGDVFIGITTSGTSENVLNAIHAASRRGLRTIALTGTNGLPGGTPCQSTLACPSCVTAKIQECHIVIAHILCGWVERALFAPVAQP